MFLQRKISTVKLDCSISEETNIELENLARKCTDSKDVIVDKLLNQSLLDEAYHLHGYAEFDDPRDFFYESWCNGADIIKVDAIEQKNHLLLVAYESSSQEDHLVLFVYFAPSDLLVPILNVKANTYEAQLLREAFDDLYFIHERAFHRAVDSKKPLYCVSKSHVQFDDAELATEHIDDDDNVDDNC